jgi:hypothetical protein
MPTPNENDADLFHYIRPYQPIGSGVRVVEAPSANECIDNIATYRESIIASERGAAADRWELLIYWAFPWGKYTLAELHARASEEQLKEIAEGRTAILSGQSASPNEQGILHEARGLLEEALRVCESGNTMRDFPLRIRKWFNKAALIPRQPATPLQEARDRGELREPLRWFTGEMEKKLTENDYKTQWPDMTNKELLDLWDNQGPLLVAKVIEGNRKEIIHRAVNIANYAMMLADKARAALAPSSKPLQEARDRGELTAQYFADLYNVFILFENNSWYWCSENPAEWEEPGPFGVTHANYRGVLPPSVITPDNRAVKIIIPAHAALAAEGAIKVIEIVNEDTARERDRIEPTTLDEVNARRGY